MDPRLQKRVQRYGWDKAAVFYEQYWQDQLAPAQTRLLEMAALRPGQRVLEIACGTGLVTFPIAEQIAPDGEIIATDISDAMIEATRKSAEERGVKGATFQRMEAETLKFDDNSFDVVICALGLMYVTDFIGSVKEMERVLKPGGRAVAAVWGERKNCGWADIFPIVDSRVQSDVCPMFFQLGGTDVLTNMFATAGLGEVQESRLPVVLEYDSAESAVGAAFAGGPVALAYSRFDEETRDEAHAEYLDSIAQHKSGDGYNIPGEFVIVGGAKP